jgi:hypothetical protein
VLLVSAKYNISKFSFVQTKILTKDELLLFQDKVGPNKV